MTKNRRTPLATLAVLAIAAAATCALAPAASTTSAPGVAPPAIDALAVRCVEGAKEYRGPKFQAQRLSPMTGSLRCA